MAKRHTEDTVRATWSHVVPDTLRYETEGHHANKQTVEINTRDEFGQPDGRTRRIATSDLFQCFWTVEAKDRLDKRKRSVKRQLRAGKEGAAEAMEALDSVARARVETCLLDPTHPRLTEAQRLLDTQHKEQEAREERKAESHKNSNEEAAALLGV